MRNEMRECCKKPVFDDNRIMGRAPLNSPQSVKAVILQLLTDGGVGQHVTPQAFRRAVSARRVRDKLGGGDPSWIARQIRAVEAEILSESSSRDAIADLPQAVAAAMRGLWQTAMAAATDEFADAREEARRAIDAARDERENADAVAAMLRIECQDVREQVAERDRKLGEIEATGRFLKQQLDEERELRQQAEAQRAELSRAHALDRESHRADLEAVRVEYEGLRRQLLKDTDTHRQTFAETQRALERELAACRQLIQQVTRERDLLAGRGGGGPASAPAEASDPARRR